MMTDELMYEFETCDLSGTGVAFRDSRKTESGEIEYYDPYEGLEIVGQAHRRSDYAIVTWYNSPEHGLLASIEYVCGKRRGTNGRLDSSVRWSEREFYALIKPAR
jgi:hypothetical protein